MTATATAPTNGATAESMEFPLAARAVAQIGAPRHPEMPPDMATRMKLAETFFQSGCCPSGFKSVAMVFVAIQYGAEIGLSPWTAVQNIAVVNGKPGIMYTAALGLVQASRLLDDYRVTHTADACTVYAKRKGMASPRSETWSDADTARANLSGNTLHKQYPRDGRLYRAGIRVLRGLFPDVLLGISTPEDIEEADSLAWVLPAAELSETHRIAAASKIDVAAIYRRVVGAEPPMGEKGDRFDWPALTNLPRETWERFAAEVRSGAPATRFARGNDALRERLGVAPASEAPSPEELPENQPDDDIPR